MENVAAVQRGMREYGVPEDELFQPVDLFEARNIKAVVRSLAALARTVSASWFSRGQAGAFDDKPSGTDRLEFVCHIHTK